LEQVLTRERSMSTGMERGIAIPHAAVDQVDRVVACMGIVSRPAGLAFESIDGQPARLIVLLVIPRSQKLLHIRTLADVARVLGIDSIRDALTAATTPAQAWEALVAGDTAERR
jgi:mannitol/fructose-specific phosphotransferase system IIA component (Ntr-type)